MHPHALRDSLTALSRAVVWHRRKLAAVAALLSVLGIVALLRPPPAPTSPVVVSARALTGGVQLTAQDLRVVNYPADQVPEESARVADLVGKTLIAGLPPGVPLTRLSVLGPPGARLPPGRVLAPVRFADAELGRLLSAGRTVDVISSRGEQAAVIARRARVVTLPQATADGGFLGADNKGLLVILEVTSEEATALAQAGADGRLGLALQS